MSNRSINLTDPLYEYLLESSLREPPVLTRLREETAAMTDGMMQVAPEQGQFMALMTEMLGVRRYLEVGTFTGYSSLAVALALPDDGEVVACDVSAEFTAVARRYWQEAGVAHKVDLRLAPATQTLQALIDAGQAGTFDFIFIDADKENYDAYYESGLVLCRQEGLITIDNVLWGGSVINQDKQDPDTIAIRSLNKKIKEDQRVTCSMLPIGDGLTLAKKR